MITKVVHGWRPAGLLAYLLGPGTAEVHRAPRVIASWDWLDAAWQPASTGRRAGGARRPAKALIRGRDTVLGTHMRCDRSGHRSAVLAAPRLPEAPRCSPADRAAPRVDRDRGIGRHRRAATVARGDREGRSAGQGAGAGGATPRRPAGRGRRERCRRVSSPTCRSAGIGWGCGGRRRGICSGYKLARPGDLTAAGEPVFYSGSKLAPDLSLPRLQQRWASTPNRQRRRCRSGAGSVGGPRGGGRGPGRTAHGQ